MRASDFYAGVLLFFGALACLAVAFALGSYAFMLAWNNVMPVFHQPVLSWEQSFCLMYVLRVLVMVKFPEYKSKGGPNEKN